MVDTKLNTGSIRKKHLMENKQEKTKKIVEKVKQTQSADGPPAKKQKKPAEKNEGKAKVANGNGTVDGERVKAKRIKHKKKAQKDKPVKNSERTEQREAQFQTESEEYLEKWKNDRTSWRFSKNLQTWLISNMLNDDKVDSDNFDILSEYLSSGQGSVRDNVTKCALNQSRLIKAKVDPKPEEAEENQEKLARCQRLIKLMTSKAKSAGGVKPKKEQGATKAAAAAKSTEEGGDAKKGKKKRRRGKADKLNLRKENKPTPAPAKVEEAASVEKKKAKVPKVVSFDETEEAPKATKAKAAVNGKGITKKSKKTKGK